MIIPVRCMTCNKVLGDLWQTYERRVKEQQDAAHAAHEVKDHKPHKKDEFSTGKILDELGVKRYCCRRHLLAHVDFMEII